MKKTNNWPYIPWSLFQPDTSYLVKPKRSIRFNHPGECALIEAQGHRSKSNFPKIGKTLPIGYIYLMQCNMNISLINFILNLGTKTV